MNTSSAHGNLLVYFLQWLREERLWTLCLMGCVGQGEQMGGAPFQSQTCNCSGF
jgi:hypothetical protein